jgi:hypothetical protein
MRTCSIARRMSWAAKRQTTRKEDMAYCLLGIFDINLPLIYGEGHRAFQRLQEEIIKTSDDPSIFCWKTKSSTFATWRGCFANSPAEFVDSGGIDLCDSEFATTNKYNDLGTPNEFRFGMTAWSMTNRGLSVTMPIVPFEDLNMHKGSFTNPAQQEWKSDFALLLYCRDTKRHNKIIAIRIMLVGDNKYVRVEPSRFEYLPEIGKTRKMPLLGTYRNVRMATVVLLRNPQNMSWNSICTGNRLAGISIQSTGRGEVIGTQPPKQWDTSTLEFRFDEGELRHGAAQRCRVLIRYQGHRVDVGLQYRPHVKLHHRLSQSVNIVHGDWNNGVAFDVRKATPKLEIHWKIALVEGEAFILIWLEKQK